MYIENDDAEKILEKFSIMSPEDCLEEHAANMGVYTEAVFANGKETVKSLEEKIQVIKDKLDEMVELQDKTTAEHKKDSKVKIQRFDPNAFWKDTCFKDFEDELMKIFGFRRVDVYPLIERYDSKHGQFSSQMMNCFVCSANRFPIEGLVTDNGFYDKSKSTSMQIQVTLGLIKNLDVDEILAVFLHEFGHGIDPALVDIKYTEINVLSKYMTDRKNAITDAEKNQLKKHGILPELTTILVIIMVYLFPFLPFLFGKFVDFVVGVFGGSKKAAEFRLKKIRKMVEKDKDKFNRREAAEAYADNFARMYGYGAILMRALKKIGKEYDDESRSRREKARQSYIIDITSMMIKDEHKTDIHRIRSLIKEYNADIDDPNTPDIVKKQLKEDLAELEKVLDEYLNNFTDFQNRVNRIINEELKKIELDESELKKIENEEKESDEKKEKETKDKKETTVKEGVEFFEESTKAYEALMKARESLNSSERAEANELFGQSKACSFAKDKKGYYCFTHRCRSKYYPSLKDIPKESVEFVRSTC